MQDKNNESMDDIEFDVLTEIGNIGAGNATTALSQLINARIDMRVPKVELLTFAELAEVIGGAETLVAGILLSLEGDIQGSMLFILESNAARLLVQQLMGCKDDSTEQFTGNWKYYFRCISVCNFKSYQYADHGFSAESCI